MLTKNIAVNFDAVDEMQLGIIQFHNRCQGAFDETIETLNVIRGIYGEIPSKAKDPALLSAIQEASSVLSNQNCMEEGQAISGFMQGLKEGLHEMEQMFSRKLSDIWGTISERNIKVTLAIYGIQIDSYPGLTPEEIMGFERMAYNYVVKEIEKGQSDGTIQEVSEADIRKCTNIVMEQLYSSNPQFVQTYLKSGRSDTKEFRMQAMLAESWAPCKQAFVIGQQLSTMEFEIEGVTYTWDKSFCEFENCYMLLEAFEYFGVEGEDRAYFLGQVFVESSFGESYIETRIFEEEYSELAYDPSLLNEYVELHRERYDLNPEEKMYIYNDLSEEVKEDYINDIGEIEANPYKLEDILLYRGGGAIQLTTKYNYYSFAHFLDGVEGFEDSAAAAEDIREYGAYSHYIQDEYRFMSAVWFCYDFNNIRLEESVSTDDVRDRVGSITEIIRPGTQERIKESENERLMFEQRVEATEKLLEILE